jgi:hypothetical protein
MSRAAILIATFLVASPVLAQDIDLGLGGDASSLLNIAAPRGNAPAAPARGAAPAGRGAAPAGARGAAPNAPPVDRLVRLREMLAAANAPLSKEQETGLNTLLNVEIPAMRQTLQKRILDIQKAKGEAPSASAAPPAAAGTPGASPNPNANLPGMDELAPEIIRLNDQLLGKIAAAPALNPDQQLIVNRLYKDQVKSRGGLDAIKLTLEDAGAPFSPEQIAQIQPLFDQQEQARLQLIKEAQGQPVDKAKTDQLQRDTLSQVLRLLTAPQRTALLAK